MKYYIDIRGKDKNTADIKAPADMCAIMEKRGYIRISFIRPTKHSKTDVLTHLHNWFKAYTSVKKGDIVVYQYPLLLGSHICVKLLMWLGKIKKAKVVLLIHDIDSLRGYNTESNKWKEKALSCADYIICHNDKMKAWLTGRGIDSNRIIPLGIFDYLTDEHAVTTKEIDEVIIAGNLSSRKSPYISKLLMSKRNYLINLYGPNFEENEKYHHYSYYGSFPADELISNMKGAYGLVWDGDSTDECSGMTGNYLRYNNPHKVSLYITAGIPVIIWKEAALAAYVEHNKLGITVGNLSEIDEKINAISPDEYKTFKTNVLSEGEKLRNGCYLNDALNIIENSH